MSGLIAILVAQATEEKTPNPLIPAWNELIWGTVAFVLLLVVLWRVGVFKKITEALAERTAKIVWGARAAGLAIVPLPEKVNRDMAGVYRFVRDNPGI